MLLSFERRDDPPGLAVVDHVERRRCSIETSSPVSPREASVSEFYFPVDRGVTVSTDRIVVPHTTPVCLRNHAGWLINELTSDDSRDLPSDRYSIELSAPVKLYFALECPFSVEVTDDGAVFEFDGPQEVLIGARSYHKRPAATISTTDDPEDMMTAVSYLGSALKTTTCERSYPTLRGHPPTIELGDELHVPDVLDRPETGVTLELPPEYRSVFVAAPLAYYLGAAVVPGAEPRLVTEGGFTHALDDPARGFEEEVARVLKQVFFLDCLSRTEGYYPVDLHERNEVEDDIGLDFPSLYERSLPAQLETYLDVPYSLIEPHLPAWKLTAHVALTPKHIESIPFVVNDLAVVYSPESHVVDQPTVESATLESFMRGNDFTRSASTRASAETASLPELVRPEETDSLEQTWLGEDLPIGASKGMIEAFHNRIDRSPADGDIDITVVCNDLAMEGERDVADEVYGSREELPFDVAIRRELTAAELRDVLHEETDFLHYIGHIDANGFECVDGTLDAATLQHTGVDSFFLNACTSYQQGMHLIEAGSIAGVVTLQDIINSGAERVGKTLARLLNRGFPIGAALNIAKEESIMGGHYLVLGDGGIDIAQAECGVPYLCSLKKIDRSIFLLDYLTYSSQSHGLGTICIPSAGDNEEYFLASGDTGRFELSKNELVEFLTQESLPIRVAGKLSWSNNILSTNNQIFD